MNVYSCFKVVSLYILIFEVNIILEIYFLVKPYFILKLGQNMELGPDIDRTLGPLVLGRSSLYIEQPPDATEV